MCFLIAIGAQKITLCVASNYNLTTERLVHYCALNQWL